MATDRRNLSQGFTVLEILLAVSIVLFIIAASSSPLTEYYRQVVFNGNLENVIAMLDEARKNTLSSYYSTSYGVYVTSTSTTLFRGTTYSSADSNNDVYELSPSVMIATSSFNGGGDEVVFDRLTGETSFFGSFDIALRADASTTRTITIHATGLVELEE